MTAQSQPLTESNPIPGWYRTRRYRNGPWLPVAIWRKADGELVCRVGEEMANLDDIWVWACGNPVKEEEARFAFEHGRWPTEPDPLPRLSNLPADPYEALLIEVKEHAKRAEEWLDAHAVLTTQAEADLARHMQVGIQDLVKRATELHGSEKAPALKACKDIDDKFRFRTELQGISARFRAKLTVFLDKMAQLARVREEQDRQKAIIDNALPPEPIKVQAGGMVGKRAGLAKEWRAKVVDYEKAALYFIKHPDLMKLVDKLAQHAVKDAKGSLEIPGVEATQVSVAR